MRGPDDGLDRQPRFMGLWRRSAHPERQAKAWEYYNEAVEKGEHPLIIGQKMHRIKHGKFEVEGDPCLGEKWTPQDERWATARQIATMVIWVLAGPLTLWLVLKLSGY